MNRNVARYTSRRLTAAAVATALGIAVAVMTPRDALAGLLMDLRVTHLNGTPVSTPKRVNANSPGDVVSIDVFAVVSGANAVNDEAFRSIVGSFRSTTGELLGDLNASLVAPFNGTGSQAGTPVDVDGDGDFDIGPAPTGGPSSAFFLPLYDGPTAYTDGAVVATDPAAEEFLIGRLTFILKQSSGGPFTFIDFLRRQNPDGTNNLGYAGWNEDGTGPASVRNGETPYSVSGVFIGAIPEPTGAAALSGLGAIGLLARRRRRGNAMSPRHKERSDAKGSTYERPSPTSGTP